MMRILSILPQCSPSLKRLFYDYSMPKQDDAISNLLSTVVLKGPLLQEVYCRTIPVSREAFEQLAGLRTLRALESAIPATGYPNPRRSSRPTFPSLQTLNLRATNIQHIQTFLERMGSKRLETLTVELSRRVDGFKDQLIYLLDLITQNQTSLRVLNIIHAHNTRLSAPQPNRDQTLSFTDISLMVDTCRNITQINFVWSNFAVDLCDDDIHAMALAWPNLQVFQITSTRPYSPRPSITLRSLLTFATHCPDLRSLSLSLDPSTPNYALRREGQAMRDRRHSLQSLNIFVWNELEHPALFPVFILDLFPNVSLDVVLICPRSMNEKLWVNWGNIDSFMRAVLASRRNTK
ncbi:hypothetical protein NLI96_g10224 [Meripilus lineatus]|uniref:F-box domain-containing protein n=1 Tax=Meripilus lineatus TaxID=2056292 RepID=A0AAD5UYL7_9APHY|nr:hypothetical protein NLI96_g10224 [Physisporinus lineatus]